MTHEEDLIEKDNEIEELKNATTLESIGVKKCACCGSKFHKEAHYIFGIKHSCIKLGKSRLSRLIHKEWGKKKDDS